MKALLVGYGKMGRAIEAVLIQRGHAVRARVEVRDRLEALDPSSVDVAFEFTTPEAAPARVEALLTAGVAVVSGTTGWDVGKAARLEIEEITGRPAYLELWVKVRRNWRKREFDLNNFGFKTPRK